MGKRFVHELDDKEYFEYGFIYDILKSIEKDGKPLENEERCFNLMQNSKDGELPVMPLIKYSPKLKVPKTAPEDLLRHISYLLKKDIKLPHALRYYLYSAFDSVINKKLDLNKAFLFQSTPNNFPTNYACIFKFVVDYMFMRVSILCTLGKSWGEVVVSKNDLGKGIYKEIAAELEFIYQRNSSCNVDGNKKTQFDFSEKNIKKIINENHLYQGIVFVNSNYVPSDDCVYSKYIKQYRSYLEYITKRKESCHPISQNDAKQRIKELDLLERYFRLTQEELPEDKRYISWLSSQSEVS